MLRLTTTLTSLSFNTHHVMHQNAQVAAAGSMDATYDEMVLMYCAHLSVARRPRDYGAGLTIDRLQVRVPAAARSGSDPGQVVHTYAVYQEVSDNHCTPGTSSSLRVLSARLLQRTAGWCC